MEAVLRYLYKIQIGPFKQYPVYRPWRFWLDVHIAADKYLVLVLSEQAYECFFSYARMEWNLDSTIDTLELLTTEMSHYDKLLSLAAELREKHLRQLLKNKRYREKLEDDKALLWEHVDQLLAAEHGQETQAHHHLAAEHGQKTQAHDPIQARQRAFDYKVRAAEQLFMQFRANRATPENWGA